MTDGTTAAPLPPPLRPLLPPRPVQELVSVVRSTLADPRVVLGGFFTLIQSPGEGSTRTLKFHTAHNFIKTYYAPLLFRPLSFLRRGGRSGAPGAQPRGQAAADWEPFRALKSTRMLKRHPAPCVPLGPWPHTALAPAAVPAGSR